MILQAHQQDWNNLYFSFNETKIDFNFNIHYIFLNELLPPEKTPLCVLFNYNPLEFMDIFQKREIYYLKIKLIESIFSEFYLLYIMTENITVFNT